MSSKLIAADSDFFANLGVNILKAHGKSARESYLLKGYALNTGRAAQGMPTRVTPARIACLVFNLQKTKMQLGVQVLVNDPRELEKILQREADMTKERIDKLLKAEANVILTAKGIDDMALKYFVEAGAITVRCVRKEDMHHIAKATGATLVVTGGGAVEAALSVYLEYLATTLGSREQLAIAEFAESLLIIPK
ncbi:hypothetical protein Droror1_Dr00023136, partial [Drosera rotundifolia]